MLGNPVKAEIVSANLSQPIRELNLRGVEGFLRFPKVV